MWADRESESDFLNFSEVSQLTTEVLESPEMLPVSIGLFGSWGVGKSTLLRLIEKEISPKKEWLVINFDAWLYQDYDDARASLLEVIAKSLHTEAKDKDTLFKKTKNLLSRVNGIRALALSADAIALSQGIYTGGLISKLTSSALTFSDGVQDKDEKKVVDATAKQIETDVPKLIAQADSATPPEQIHQFRDNYKEIVKDFDKKIVVFIDNLDRCLPANAINTLEAIRLFLFLPNTAFVIAADEDMIRLAVSEHYQNISDQHKLDYLDKLIQVPVRVPKAGVYEIRAYLFMLYAKDLLRCQEKIEKLRQALEKSLQNSWKEEPITRDKALEACDGSENQELMSAFHRADNIAPILSTASFINGNPRIVKRMLNVIKMRYKVASKRQMITLDEGVITKLVIFERCASSEATKDLYELIDKEDGKPAVIKTLEELDTGENIPDGLPDSWLKNDSIKAFVRDWTKLEPALSNVDLKPAAYLARETLPLSVTVTGLSQQARNVFNILLSATTVSSPAGKKAVKTLPVAEEVQVMEGLVKSLNQTQDWQTQPKGIYGARILSSHSEQARRILDSFIERKFSDTARPPWVSMMFKNES